MIRKYNYTGRQKISRDRIKILQKEKLGIKSFEVDLSINDLGLPDYAKVYIEPYFKSSSMRFDLGTVARFNRPDNTELIGIPITDKVLYRIKIVDESQKNGLILGYADEIEATVGSHNGGRKPLLTVDFNDLGNRIWKLEFRDEGPVLSVNWEGKIEKIREIVSKDKMFLSLVYPEVIRQIAVEISKNEEFDFDEDSTVWQSLWLRFFSQSLGITYIPSKDDPKDLIDWADNVSNAFCRKNNLINLLTDK
jgi:hypothetical protein